ncbi:MULTISPECIES: AAA family ATPase [unclassified Gemella]|uniref:AAA family ATPase n=1 Tax=unclassified Gemella TaxID=2624949 RepID=UPI001C04092F|nr:MULTISPECIES: AAA family ATPase [unclassified Gemella]MBU0278086.1 AAA family ATPase [Gemella sp. zg-1178]QWQ38388.1 AAA family ATPase [Gemella sp. zg-570]
MLDLEIKKIDIKNFGCYKNYKQHDRSGIGNDFKAERVNIFFGRNYSGKTTYSKIFQSIELKQLPEKYEDIDFEIKLANHTVIKSNEIKTHTLPITCKVFNQRFIDDNIYLHNDNKLNSFQISIGRDTNKTLKEIEYITLNEIKPREDKLSEIVLDIEKKSKELKSEEESLNSKLSKTASKIKNQKNPSVVIAKRYDIRNIKEEFEKHSSRFPIFPSPEDTAAVIELEKKIEQAKTRILEENISKPKKIDLVNFDATFNFTLFLENTKKLLSKVVSVSNILDEYKNNPDKINWIKDGVDIHGENPEKCVFCGNSIDSGFIEKLKLAFSDELSSLENELSLQNGRVNSEILRLDSLRLDSFPYINKDDYFKDSTSSIQNINKDIRNIIKNRKEILKTLESKISEKQRNIFSKIEIDNLKWNEFSEIQVDIDSLYDSTIKQIETFEKRKIESIDFLRRYYIAKEFSISEFTRLSQKIIQLQEDIKTKTDEQESLKREKEGFENDILERESSLKSESEAVRRINMILQNSLAHSEISLKSVDDEEGVYFEVSRNEERAYNLSEGEKSLIAFAYYIARLESLSDEEKSKTILFIDDPISSLDENNIFYIYNLIFRLLEKKEFLQYFLSTHNLDFLKYTNRFSAKKDYYLIEKIKEAETAPSRSFIKKLPKHLSNKVTEFVFLFEQIYKVAMENEDEGNYGVFYNFPNNARKFIEILLYFKFPNYKMENDKKILKYFGKENSPFIQRINNEYSHGEDRFDRTRNPINTSEFKHDARIILGVLYRKDKIQFKSFLKNSDLTEPGFLEKYKKKLK